MCSEGNKSIITIKGKAMEFQTKGKPVIVATSAYTELNFAIPSPSLTLIPIC